MPENTVKTYIRVDGQDVDADSVAGPSDRTYRGAWTTSGVRIVVDMEKARAIHRDTLRRERAPRLSALDVAYMRGLETGADTTAIATEKQRLRDVTHDPRIEDAQTPDALSALTLDALLA